MREKWVDIQDYKGYYKVSNYGRIKSVERHVNHYVAKRKIIRSRILKAALMSDGYPGVSLTKKNNPVSKLIHIIVAKHFIKNPLKLPQVNHKDGDKQNNNYKNLEWVTSSQNAIHAYSIKLRKKRPPPSKQELHRLKQGMKSKAITLIHVKTGKISTYKSISEASRAIRVDQSTISKAKARNYFINKMQYKIV